MTGRLVEPLQRLRLRPLREADLAAFLVYRSDPDVARLQGWKPMSRQEAGECLEESASATGFAPGKWTQIAIADLSTDCLIGDLGVYVSPDQTNAEFGITITPAAQGKGYATEAIRGLIRLLFSTTPVARIVACTDVRNAPCISALRRAGMSHDGVREAEYKGESCTESLFSTQRPDGRGVIRMLKEVGGVPIQPRHRATCHCGAVELELELPNGIEDPRRCDCSICRRKGAVVASVPLAGIRIVKGAGNLKLYQFNTHTARHYFCDTCGIYTHHQRRSNPAQYGFNVGCLEGIDPFAIPDVPVNDGIHHPADRAGD